ncbi:LPS assembly outer membrane protein LptD (organic solvent tolerance protein OstA) [Flavobacterium fryxellicola]|uniref:Organic solvent tolerance protein OstA n=1 Tax=Flavobacterium fryxellicola TaxID=249352 RepID=A0A167Y9U1_9FLAO|nr:putative LPS assembly protein LptD [Flavobacterium fryxellicola]OAB29159.1 organic solvent tolerance protein OstA [Flavobacterium fryxellicola]SHN57901.1 LPS assembly outer membrane protein LptD (organic solvent tolerance protein OstA) [Flavobacterium fryxellicola]
MTCQKTGHTFTKIAFKPLHTNLFNIVLISIFLSIGSGTSYSQDITKKKTVIPANKQADSEKPTVNTIKTPVLAVQKQSDTIKIDSIKPKKAFLDGKVKYKADKYAKIDQKKKTITLYDQAELYYQDIELKSGIIVMDYEKNEVYAGRIKDSTGTYTQFPNFKQGANVIEPDSIRFNFKTKKALIWNSRSEQGEFKIKAAVTKKENDSVYFLKGARFTTSKDVDNPEYYFQTNKVKFIPGKKVVTGLTNMVIANVPTPIALPFAFFPMSKETSISGLILPSYNDSNNRGFSLQNLGYYFALSDNYDLTVLGDYYTNGSYGLRFESSYAKRYNFVGNLNIRFENLITSERGYPDYLKQNIYNIQWSHSKDSKSNPNSSFSASVNLGSSKYFKQSINQVNIGSNLNNTLSSSVSYSKTFTTVPQVRMSLTATHSQNTQTEEINMTLPTLQLSVDRIYPFVGKDGVRKGFIKNINLQYNLNGRNSIVTTDSLFFKPQMFRDAKIGFQHSIPLSTNFKLFKYFSASTAVNYEEIWYTKTIERSYDTDQSKVVDKTINGFDAFRTYSFSSSVGTTIYGTFNFGKDKKIKSIRHVMRPSASYGYTPSFEKYYDTYASDASGTMIQQYSRFENGIYGAPGLSNANTLGFDLSNTFEAKVTDRDSTKVEPKKIMLLNNLNLSTSYNLDADGVTSLAFSPVRVSGGTTLLDNKMNVNFGATLDPYAIDNSGRRINVFNINNGGSLFRMTSSNMTLNYSIASTGKDKIKKDKNSLSQRNGGREDDLFGTNTDLGDSRRSQFDDQEEDEGEDKISQFFNSKLPWDMTFAYSLTYGNNNRENKIIGNSIMISANADITPKWKAGVSTGYDFVQNGVTFTQLRFERDLLSWRMDFNWSPFGTNANWGFFIGIKSGVLSDIKWDKRSVINR